MSDRDNELIAAHAAHAQRQALQHISDEAQNVAQTYQQQVARGDSDGASWTLRQWATLANEYKEIASAGQQPQQQQAAQPQQQQAQQQYTEAEQDLMRHYPDQVRKNWNVAQIAANNLLASKRQSDPEIDLWAYRNSAEYISGIAHACGITDASGAESIEIASPNEALAACKSKYGNVSESEYNFGVQKLIEMKKLGYYRPE